MAQADTLLEGYAETASRTALLVEQASRDLETQRAEGRVIVLLLGLLIGLGQLVPLSLGWWVRRSDPMNQMKSPTGRLKPGASGRHGAGRKETDR